MPGNFLGINYRRTINAGYFLQAGAETHAQASLDAVTGSD